MALAAARARHPEAAALDVLDLEITRPLLLERDSGRETRFSVTGERGVFELASRTRLSGEPWTVHATGRIGAGSLAPMPDLAPAGAGSPDQTTRHLAPDALYALTTRLGLQYGPAFQTVSLVASTGRDALVSLVPDQAGREAGGFLTDPARLDGALQGLVALAADQVDASGALLPWRIGRVRLAQPAGIRVAAARLRVNRVGPRSIAADVSLLDAAGSVVAVLADCWFTRVGAPAHDELADSSFHGVFSPRPRPGDVAPPAPLPALTATPDAGEDEAALLTEAYIAAVAYAALAGLPGPVGVGQPFTPAALVASGQVHAESRPLLDAALVWLERDGLAQNDAGSWT